MPRLSGAGVASTFMVVVLCLSRALVKNERAVAAGMVGERGSSPLEILVGRSRIYRVDLALGRVSAGFPSRSWHVLAQLATEKSWGGFSMRSPFLAEDLEIPVAEG